MLSQPEYGWTDFELEGTSRYGLSYSDDIAFEWIDKAICGLETLKPFCVKGYMEPGRFLCVVSYWNCHILTENDHNGVLQQGEIEQEYSHTGMLDFCKALYNDVNKYVDDWAAFADHHTGQRYPFKKKRSLLKKKLKTLNKLIAVQEKAFGTDKSFC